MSKLIPGWLHCKLLRLAWYRRKCGIPELSPAMRLLAKDLASALQGLDFAATLNREYDAGAFDHLKAGTVKIRRPMPYTQRASGA